MNRAYENNEYINLVSDILYNNDFKKIDNCIHHGMSRLNHSLRVSYYSYIITKKMRLNYKEVARAGLLHDFFITEDLSEKERIISAFVHPRVALKNSNDKFILSDMGKDIIISHMFPLIPNKIPKYLESWIVSMVDKFVATYEFSYSYGSLALSKLPNAYVILLLLMFRFGL